MTAKPLTVISIFSGGMGLDVGLENTGRYDLLAAVEVDPIFCETIRINRDAGRIGRPETRVYNLDIRNLDPQTLLDDLGLKPGELDLLVGGPPCQAFSTSGRRQSVEDRRGTLLWDFIRFVEVLQPKFFLMENVRGLVSAALRHRPIAERPERGGKPLAADEQPGSVLRQFAADLVALEDSHYRVDAFEVNAANYGAAQIRERLLCIGNRMGHIVEFPEPTHGTEQPTEQPFTTLGDVIGALSEANPEVLDFSPRKKSYLRMVPPGGNWRSLPEEVQRESMGRAFHAKGGRSGWWRRLSMDLPCPTIVTMPNHASTSLCHPTEVRALSVSECALVQGFPHDWTFAGRTQDKYVQIGNAVPTVLGRVAGDVIADHLEALNQPEVAHEAADDFRIVYLRSHIRTRRWFSKGKSIVWGDDDAQTAAYSAPVTQRRERAFGVPC